MGTIFLILSPIFSIISNYYGIDADVVRSISFTLIGLGGGMQTYGIFIMWLEPKKEFARKEKEHRDLMEKVEKLPPEEAIDLLLKK